MNDKTAGIHHVTAIASDPQRNIDFYAGVLGLRLVKITVNYDDPGTYHLYSGDENGSPGSILTFFAWPGARRGRRGAAQTTAASFAVPEGAVPYWRDRLQAAGTVASAVDQCGNGGDRAVQFEDPDGMLLRIVEAPAVAQLPAWSGADVPPEAAIRRLQGVTLTVREAAPTALTLTRDLGMALAAGDGNVSRFSPPGSDGETIVEVVESHEPYGAIAVGSIHHVAWRAPDALSQVAWQTRLQSEGYGVSPVMDRQYFESIYFREPGGILFEIATDGPGFTADESLASLGSSLRLPDWLEPRRREIERALPSIRTAAVTQRVESRA
jgi:glyoxalase family protein